MQNRVNQQPTTAWDWEYNYGGIIYLTIVHSMALYGLSLLPSCMSRTLLFSVFLWFQSGLGITAGAHRLWSHRSYTANLPIRIYLMLLTCLANQGSIFHWCRDHRVHHKFSETDADPHNAQRGFFFSHIGWLLVKKHPAVVASGKKLDFADLWADPVVRFQQRLNPFLALFVCFAVPPLMAHAWGESYWNGFFVAGVLRYVVVLHCTWLVNSAAHLYGHRPYDPKINPAENLLVAICSVGEGWHNWHHKYPFDYAASEFGISARFNPTKLFIDTFAAVGWITNRKRALSAWHRAQKRTD